MNKKIIKKANIKKEIIETDSKENEQKNQLDDFKDKYLRLLADFENYKKRIIKEKKDITIDIKNRTISDFVFIISEIELAMNFSNDKSSNIKSLIEGIKLIKTKLSDVLLNNGVEFINAKTGDNFDPHLHMAISESNLEDYDDSVVTEQYKSGYKLDGRMMSPALVVVNKRIIIKE